MAGKTDTPTTTVVESKSGSAGTIDHGGDAPIRCVVKYLYVRESTKFDDLFSDTPALDAVESASELVQRTTPHGGIIACNTYAVTRSDILLAPLSAMRELVQLEEVTYDGFLHDLKCDDIGKVVLLKLKVDSAELRLKLVPYDLDPF
ncbi:hypothetical protein Plhal304r1_c005g0021231 [Plasmopara halstedii]